MSDQEQIVINSFRDHYDSFPKGKIVKSESPDFIIQDGPKKKTGVELVQLLPPPEHHYSMVGILKPRYAYEQLMMTILLKNRKRHLYNHPYLQSIWLLIHIDYMDDKGSVNMENQIEKWTFPSDFDQVFLFDLFENKTYRIATGKV